MSFVASIFKVMRYPLLTVEAIDRDCVLEETFIKSAVTSLALPEQKGVLPLLSRRFYTICYAVSTSKINVGSASRVLLDQLKVFTYFLT